jgi:putative transcriptional regulator
MEVYVIRWKLNEVMAKKRVRNKDLAKVLCITENSVYRLRRTDEMPRLSPERLNGICAALKCQPGDLLEWITDLDESTSVPVNPSSKERQTKVNSITSRQNDTQLKAS